MDEKLDALEFAKETCKSVPAYKDFLQKIGIGTQQLEDLKDINFLPITDKENYIRAYPLEQHFPGGKIPSFVCASSGSSGSPTFWFRSSEQISTGAILHETILRDIFQIKKEESTLAIICFSMGVWVAGSFTSASLLELADKKDYRLTITTPGLEKGDILNILKNLAPSFKNVILIGYPPFIMDIVSATHSSKIVLPKSFFILTSGDKFSETWRGDLMHHSGINKPEYVLSLYGTADAGPLAFETPLTIRFRQVLENNPLLRKEFQKTSSDLPGVFQYDERFLFLETEAAELLITAKTAAPLIRYNIHDECVLFAPTEALELLKKEGASEQELADLKRWNSPIVIKGGRTDVAVTFYALNIYPENIQAGLSSAQISKKMSGQYFAYNKDTRNSTRQHLAINIELTPKTKKTPALRKKIQAIIIDGLLKTNIEYRKLLTSIGKRAYPQIKLFTANDGGFKTPGARGILNLKGKKTRISN